MEMLVGTTPLRGAVGGAVRTLGIRIVAGHWGEGDTIDHEQVLMEDLGVSRSVLREAYRILAAKGMIEAKTSVGTSVRPRSAWRMLDPDVIGWRMQADDHCALMADVLRVRYALEPGIVYLATQVAEPQAVTRVTAAWHAIEQQYKLHLAGQGLDKDVLLKTDLEFHTALVAAAGSEMLNQLFTVLEIALNTLMEKWSREQDETGEQHSMDDIHLMHRDIYLAFMRRDAEAAQSATRHLNQAMQQQLMPQQPHMAGVSKLARA